MRLDVLNEFILMVSLSNHGLVAVRRAHREAMGDIVFSGVLEHAFDGIKSVL
jgi:hypothetical protein